MEINAITFGVAEMARALDFYAGVLGLPVTYGGDAEPFTTLKLGSNFINLFTHDGNIAFWGRVVLHVEDPDQIYRDLCAAVTDGRLPKSCEPHAPPDDAPWGERYFHVNDPDGHQLSFARLL